MYYLDNIALGFATATTLMNLGYCFIGVLLGTAVGVLPGLGPVATIAMLLPITFGLPPETALIMLAGIYYGAQYGGSTTAILVNLPGESSSVVTTIDGYKMAQKGRAGVALCTAALGSFFAGTVATCVIVIFAPVLSSWAVQFGAAEYFSLMVLGLVASIILASGSIFHALGMVVIGILLGFVGTDVNSGYARYTFGTQMLSDGLDFVVIAMGIFGLGEIIANVRRAEEGRATTHEITTLWPGREDLRRMVRPVLRGTALGSVLGVLPGGGALLAAFVSYSVEKKLSPNSAEFGNGALEGVAAPEAANNAGAQTSFIPMLTLGIPSNAVMALMVGAMIIQGIQPGPGVITENPKLFWGLIASMWIGNMMLVILNLPLVGIWARMATIPYKFLYPMIMMFCCIGVFSLENETPAVLLMSLFGVLGYILRRFGAEPAPMLLAFILGPMLEEYFRRALLISQGDATVFLTSPISASLLVVALVLMLVVSLPAVVKKREVAFQED
ncbi:tripartite tricarboxylate transporter permease [Ensifer adhaerens]|uniref:tripartite tricarboxylate transporter permease n=1 Tax=Ensifer adhaerens TaxID=106592 RepID=UPI0023A98D0F|nr:tripartite tricarboxylate transporter permease [Ensifer adhaerens]WDZ76230.1 tripartite tricarboxylate transporter permease [Ensifer adhaerens]